MPDTAGLSETKRTLLKKYLGGNLPQVARIEDTLPRQAGTEVGDIRARVVEVQAGGSKRPFFFLHGNWKGTAFFCFSLAHELGPDQPFYALEPYQFDGLSVPPSIETMAAAHIKSMRTVQPEGPYRLGGWCNGGLVAYEMARQLHAAKQVVDLLVLIDPMYLGYRSRRRLLRVVISRLGGLLGLAADKQLDCFIRLWYVSKPLFSMMHALLQVRKRLQNVRHEGSQDSIQLIINDVLSFAQQNVMTIIKRIASMFEHKPVAVPYHDPFVLTTEALRQDYPCIFEWSDMAYKPPGLYPGKITFFLPSKEPWHIISAGWRQVIEAKEARDVEVYVISGNQDTWMTKYLHILAQQLSACLSKLQGTTLS